MNSKYNALETQKKDIVEYLKHSLLGKEEEVDELTERLERQQQAASNERDALQQQHSQLKEELLNRIEELTTENEGLGETEYLCGLNQGRVHLFISPLLLCHIPLIVARLSGLEELQKRSEQLTANIESLEKELACQKEEHKAEIHNQEMRVLQEKWRLRLLIIIAYLSYIFLAVFLIASRDLSQRAHPTNTSSPFSVSLAFQCTS